MASVPPAPTPPAAAKSGSTRSRNNGVGDDGTAAAAAAGGERGGDEIGSANIDGGGLGSYAEFSSRLEELEALKWQAVAAEEYRLAADLKDEINALKMMGPPSPPPPRRQKQGAEGPSTVRTTSVGSVCDGGGGGRCDDVSAGIFEVCEGETRSHTGSSNGCGGSGDSGNGQEATGGAFPDLVGLLPPLALKPLDLNHLASTD